MQRLQIKPKLDFALLKIEKVNFCVHWFTEYFNGFRLYFKEIRSLYAGNTKISEAFLGEFHSSCQQILFLFFATYNYQTI